MKNASRARAQLRPHGMIAAGCHHCKFLPTCGGIQPDQSLLDCFEILCCRKPDDCKFHCTKNNFYIDDMREVKTYGFRDLEPLRQDRMFGLPRYIPVIQHGSSRVTDLSCGMVAINTHDVLKLKAGKLCSSVTDGRELRSKWKLNAKTQVILCGTGDDPPLERYYENRRRDNIPAILAGLGVTLAIGPNFSHILDVVRTDNMFNRRRQLMCLAELSAVGINAVPHLNHAQQGDWEYWADYLKYNSSVVYVAKEFQTGNRNKSQGETTLREIQRIQDKIGRALHPILIGGAQFTESAAIMFENFSILDSNPFSKARARRLYFMRDSKLESNPLRDTTVGWRYEDPIDHVLANNISEYSQAISLRTEAARNRHARQAAV